MDPMELLSIATGDNDLRVVTRIVNAVPVTDDTIPDYVDVLILATKNDYLDIVNMLIEAGVTYYDDAIATAALYGHLNTVNMLIEAGAEDGYDDALVLAAKYGHLDIVNRLIEAGAGHYKDALIEAKKSCHTDIVNMLNYVIHNS